jgi:hypothetical protein
MTNAEIFSLQRAQRIGRATETVRAVLKVGSQTASFEKWNATLDTATVIGIVVLFPKASGSMSITGDLLLTETQASSAVLRLSHQNKDNFEAPLRLFSTEGKNLAFIPIEPITGLNYAQSEVKFPESSTVAGVIELVFVTA